MCSSNANQTTQCSQTQCDCTFPMLLVCNQIQDVGSIYTIRIKCPKNIYYCLQKDVVLKISQYSVVTYVGPTSYWYSLVYFGRRYYSAGLQHAHLLYS